LQASLNQGGQSQRAGKRPTYRITEEALAEYMKENERHKLKPPAQFKHLKVKVA
jgi:hypothetical protein